MDKQEPTPLVETGSRPFGNYFWLNGEAI